MNWKKHVGTKENMRKIMSKTSFREHLNEKLNDPEFREEWDALEPLYTLKRQLIEARMRENLSQAELAARCGMKQSAVARLENGNTIPTIPSLQRIAKGLGKKLTLTFS